MSKQTDRARQHWMAAYETALVAECPRLTGKVDWNEAIYFFHLGRDAKESATLIGKRYNGEHPCRHRDSGRGICVDCGEPI